MYIWVLGWKYGEGDGGLKRAYQSAERARQDLDLVMDQSYHDGRQWFLKKVPVIGATKEDESVP